MPLIYMIRHGEAAASWDKDANPGLSVRGVSQARDVTADMATRLQKPLPILTSPMLRCRETAEALASAWKVQARVEPRVIEVPSPVSDLKERHLWLRGIMKGDWAAADKTAPDLILWRKRMMEALMELSEDTIVFTHFIAINAAASFARKDPRVVNFMPDYCSITLFETGGGELRLLERGREMETKVK